MIKNKILDKIDSRLEELQNSLRRAKDQVNVGDQYTQEFWELQQRMEELSSFKAWLTEVKPEET